MLPLLEGNGTRSYTSLTPVNPTVGKNYTMHYDVVSKEFEYWRYKKYSGLVTVLLYKQLPCSCSVLRACAEVCLGKVANSLQT
jgi:hypothetical protein